MSLVDQFIEIGIDGLLASPLGLVVLVWLLLWMIFTVRLKEKQKQYEATVETVCLEVKIEELSERSPLAMEQIFAALHAIHQNFTWGERFIGRIVLTFSCEIVSIGGLVSYFFKLPSRYRNLLESAIFAQYPKAEVNEVEDYLKNISKNFEPDDVEFDFWGTQWLKKKNNAYPIRTYEGFEHTAQETIIDPLSNVLEVMSNLEAHELLAYQLVLKPVDDDWKKSVKKILDDLKGVPKKAGFSFFDNVFMAFFGVLIDGVYKALFQQGQEEGKRTSTPRDEPPSQMLHKTEGEKQIIAAIEHTLSKIGYAAKVRMLYLAPKDKYNAASRIPEIVGAYRNFDDVSLNGLKPDVSGTWTNPAFKISERMEKKLTYFRSLKRKRKFLFNFIGRSNWRGTGYTILNTEELATVYHFPQAPNVRVSQLEKVETIKSAPPQNLPTG
ncbi:MAG: hypothetical protein Q8P83_01770 [bacterium]|nr:hypothetical protein [bacterium]